jgi:hypothetical protein
MGIYRPRTHREGDHFHFSQQIFILFEGGARPAGQRMNNFLPGKNFLCPTMGLSYPDMSLCCTRTFLPTARSKNVCRLTTKADSCQCDGEYSLSVCNSTLREARGKHSPVLNAIWILSA